MNWLRLHRREVLACAFLALLILGVFGQVRNFEFIVHDDPVFVSENPHIKYGISWEGIRWAFSADLVKDMIDADYWRPLTFISHMLDAKFYGMHPSGHHITNLLFHILNAFLVFLLLRNTTNQFWPSFLTACLFSIHPLQAQPVAWVTARKDLLSTFFGLFSLWMYVISVRNPGKLFWKILAAFSFACGLMCKPMLMILPALMLVLDFWPLKRRLNSILITEKILFWILSIISLAILTIGKTRMSIDVPRNFEYLNIAFNLREYFIHFFIPVHLSLYEPIAEEHIPILQALTTYGFLFAILLGAWLLRKKMPFFLAGILWFLCAIAPSALLTRADRFMYVPIIGLLIAVVFGMSNWFDRLRISRSVSILLCAGTLLTFIPLTFSETSKWKDGIRLFTTVIAENPDYNRAYYILGVAFDLENKNDEAIAYYKKSLSVQPKDSGIYNQIGLVYLKQGKFREAILNFLKATRAFDKPEIRSINDNNIGLALKQMGKPDLARIHFNRSRRFNPKFAQPYYNLGQMAFEDGRVQTAERLLRKAIDANPYYEEARIELGLLLASSGKSDQALEQFMSILRFNPHSLRANNNAGSVLLHTGRISEARKYIEQALRDDPNYETAKKNLEIINSK